MTRYEDGPRDVIELSEPRRHALRWLARELAWERTLTRLRETPERAAA